MRKLIKKIATIVATVTMISAMGISAFAETDDDYFMIAGDAGLFNVDNKDDSSFWNTIEESQELAKVDGMDGVYSNKFTSIAGDFQFKILKNGADFGWNFQMCIGNPDAAWADNQTQFQATMEAGEYVVYAKPSTGFVCIIQNQKAVPMIGRYHSRDEDSANYVELNKAAIEADGYADVPDFDAAYAEFINECVVKEGGTAVEPESTTAAPEETTLDTTTEADDKTTAADKADDKEDDSDDGISPVVIVVIVVAVVAVIAIIVAVSKKKKN